MTGAQAQDMLYQNLYVPAFFGKLANDYGINPQSQEQANTLLRMAGKLRQSYDASAQVKTASAQDPLAAFEQALDQDLGLNTRNEAAEISKVAAHLTGNAALKAAAISYQNSYAQAVLNAQAQG